MMGYWLCAFLWGLVLLEEIQRIPPQEWKAEGLKKVLLLRRTRTRTAYQLALVVGALFLYSESSRVLVDESTFDLDQVLALAGVLWGGYLSAVTMKGKR
ncbi:hypothetical protein LP414_28775 [Polaromonas sp. P1(28)-13]|nr:hypothetical protein LP417_27770 [Polaromonas sp. P1-6]UUZ75650.1 hypothetical protein LP414_28775 [Polaromonas sp. P1(28)-13]